MKVKVLSLLVPALLVAGAANAAEIYNKDGNKLDLYGKVDGLHYFSDDDSADGDQTYMRLGFKGETQVNDQLTGYGQWEYQIQGNSGENENNSWTRVAFAGLKFADAGSFDYGRNYGVVYDVTSWTDVLPEFGGDTYGSDNFMQQRGNGFATYRNQDFFGLVDGLNFALQYQGKNGSASGEGQTNNGRDALRQNGDGYGGSLTYDLGEGFAIGTAVTSSKRTADQNAAGYYGEGDRAETYTGGLKYDATTSTWLHSILRLTTRPVRATWAGLTKRRTSKWLRSISSTSVCVHPWRTCNLKVRTWKTATATRIC